MTQSLSPDVTGAVERKPRPVGMSDAVYEAWSKIRTGPDYVPTRYAAYEATIAGLSDQVTRLSAALGEAREAIGGVIQWDASRNYIVPYRVRDPLHSFLSKLQNDERRARTALQQQEARDGRE